MSVGLPAVFT